MKTVIPDRIKPFFWSYNTSKLDLERDKRRIITNVLNFGTREATEWLFSVYSKKDIAESLINSLPGEWDRKSFNYWSLVLGVRADFRKKRF